MGFPIEGTDKELFSFDVSTGTMPLWINPLPIKMTPSASFMAGLAGDISLTIDQGHLGKDDLQDVVLGGARLRPSIDYEARSGSIIIDLKRAFLNMLTPGVYTVRANLPRGLHADASIRVLGLANAAGTMPPKTGDTAMPFLWAGLAVLAGTTLITMILRRKRRR